MWACGLGSRLSVWGLELRAVRLGLESHRSFILVVCWLGKGSGEAP